MDIRKIFESIYENKAWGKGETVCGQGSKLENTVEIRSILPKIIKDYGIASILDAGCGDLNWMKLIPIDIEYFGIDIVDSHIESNIKLYGNHKRTFYQGDITECDLPLVDLIICRDVLYHLSFANIKKTLKNFAKAHSRYILLTSMGIPVGRTGKTENYEIVDGRYRRLNFQRAPFNFPDPIYQFKDGNRQEIMCLYRIQDIMESSFLKENTDENTNK